MRPNLLSSSFESLSDLYHGILQKYEKRDTIAAARWLKTALWIIGFAWTLHYRGSLAAAVAVVALPQVLVLLLPAIPRYFIERREGSAIRRDGACDLAGCHSRVFFCAGGCLLFAGVARPAAAAQAWANSVVIAVGQMRLLYRTGTT